MPLLCHILDLMKDVFEDIIIVTKDNIQAERIKQISNVGKIITDNSKDFSPIIGVKKGIQEIKNNSFFLTACDMPFLTKEIIWKLNKTSKQYSCTIAFSKRYQPFCAIYDKSLFKGCTINQRMTQLIENANVNIIYFNNPLNFLNINTLTDLKNAEIIKKNNY